MFKSTLLAAFLASSAISGAAVAQTASPTPGTAATSNETPTTGEQQDVYTPPPPPAPEEAQSRAEFLQAQVDALQSQLDALKTQMAAVTPTWKGAPQFDNKSDGFSFKVKGFAQFDAGYISTPGPNRATTAALDYNNLGFGARSRRLVFGAEGALPGGFGYKAEFDLAQGTVSYEDIVLTYQRPGSPLQVTIGNFYPLSSLETMTSSRLTSFLERASFTQAFGYNRRLGAAIGLSDPIADAYTLTGGVWSQEINNANVGTTRTGWQASVRGTYSPQFGSTRLHVGANFQHRVNQKDAQNRTYSSAPLTQITNVSFDNTGAIAEKGDDILGVELGGIHGPFHFAGEIQKVWVDGIRPADFATLGLNNATGCAVATCGYADDPSFVTGYAEVGFYLTGESRGYKGGKWDRTKVLHPFDKGGMGAFQINARFDYLNLGDRVAGTTLIAPNYVNGGRQTGYEASLIWNPIDYIRFLAQFGHANYRGGPRAATIAPTSTDPVNERTFSVDSFALRAQVEF